MRGSPVTPYRETLSCVRLGQGERRVERGRRGAELCGAGVVELSRLDGRDSHVAVDLLQNEQKCVLRLPATTTAAAWRNKHTNNKITMKAFIKRCVSG